jgi:hypothetical protein
MSSRVLKFGVLTGLGVMGLRTRKNRSKDQ